MLFIKLHLTQIYNVKRSVRIEAASVLMAHKDICPIYQPLRSRRIWHKVNF